MAALNLKRCVLLGHSGFIGKHLCSLLHEKDPEIEKICLSSSDLDLTERSEVNGLADVFDAETVVVLLAAVKRQTGDTQESFDINTSMVANVCRVLRDNPVGRFIYFSSTAVYGEDVQHPTITEKTCVQPTSYYGVNKYTSERLLFKAMQNHASASLVFMRPATAYGPGDGLLPYGPSGFVHAAVHNRPITLWGDGSELREFIYIDDLVEITRNVLFQNFSGALNVVAGKSFSFLDVIDKINKISSKPLEVGSKPRSKQKVDNHFDNAKLAELMPDFHFTSLDKGIALTYQSMKGDAEK